MSTVLLSPIWQGDFWRVKLIWPNRTPRFFGKFGSQAEAKKWVEKHRWLTAQPQEPGAVDPEAVDDPC
jgi:hypothetical protein